MMEKETKIGEIHPKQKGIIKEYREKYSLYSVKFKTKRSARKEKKGAHL